MNLQDRIMLMTKLGEYMQQNNDDYQLVKEKANQSNPWFTPGFINLASDNIARAFLQENLLRQWLQSYTIPEAHTEPRNIGIVMAGNIPMVGFHDLLSVFMSGHHAVIKPSSKDDVLIRHLVEKLISWDERVATRIIFSEKISGCDAYIATGSNNTGRYFEYYFGKYPHLIRYNRTSVAVLDGNETEQALDSLADDICLYFGLGCRNITKLFVPEGYDFTPLLDALKKYDYFMDFHKYRHNYDYHLALLMMSNKFYMTNGSTIFAENVSPFTPVSQVHYEFYSDPSAVTEQLANNPDIQTIAGKGFAPFGQAQQPALHQYADGVDTMQFLLNL